jgi:phosphohistidine swiveling domain-containing protein
VAEGLARTVLDPQTATLEKGEVLVTPGTDSGWTPLFLNAVRLVTEVGWLMTHGSVVAREYGILAVVGVPGATRASRTGQRVRVHGDTSHVQVLSGESGQMVVPGKEAPIIRNANWRDRWEYPFRPHRLDLAMGRLHHIDEDEGEPPAPNEDRMRTLSKRAFPLEARDEFYKAADQIGNLRLDRVSLAFAGTKAKSEIIYLRFTGVWDPKRLAGYLRGSRFCSRVHHQEANPYSTP